MVGIKNEFSDKRDEQTLLVNVISFINKYCYMLIKKFVIGDVSTKINTKIEHNKIGWK
jgi:hypothetical protein